MLCLCVSLRAWCSGVALYPDPAQRSVEVGSCFFFVRVPSRSALPLHTELQQVVTLLPVSLCASVCGRANVLCSVLGKALHVTSLNTAPSPPTRRRRSGGAPRTAGVVARVARIPTESRSDAEREKDLSNPLRTFEESTLVSLLLASAPSPCPAQPCAVQRASCVCLLQSWMCLCARAHALSSTRVAAVSASPETAHYTQRDNADSVFCMALTAAHMLARKCSR